MVPYQKINISKGIDVNKTRINRKSFAIIGFLKMLDSNFKNMFVMDVMIY